MEKMDSFSAAAASSLSTPALSLYKIDEDSLREIFIRLPIEYIFRFSCVSKQCLSFTADSRSMARKRNSFTPLVPWGFFYEYCYGA
ncbi:hypothetical protein C5167_036556 [Papaver somniferum]|uniref:F-box domain-containing protein n=1 Tax=Papaver somniferum TaxID=3469 RepID=A0A4Y7I7K3_PAPSO|nr:hypothetical protein C5167_036556 [Papaver somniferum]